MADFGGRSGDEETMTLLFGLCDVFFRNFAIFRNFGQNLSLGPVELRKGGFLAIFSKLGILKRNLPPPKTPLELAPQQNFPENSISKKSGHFSKILKKIWGQKKGGVQK